MAVLAAGLAGVAVLLGMQGRSQSVLVTPAPASWRSPSWFLVLALALAVLPWFAQLSGRAVVLGCIVAASLGDLARRWRRKRQRARMERRRTRVLEVCELIAADVRAGLPPGSGLRAAAAHWPEFAPVTRAWELGADVPTALRGLAALPGADQARILAAAWQVAHRSGSGLADALDLAAGSLRDERATATVVATEVASARATANILAVLPVAVLVLGSGVGGDPWGFLVGTVPGLVCLGTGLGLAHLGLAWLDRIADGVTS